MRRLLTVTLLWLLTTLAMGQDGQLIRKFDENAGLSQGHCTQILQDKDGFIWLATWNGLNRFDGYEFQRMASRAGDGCNMPSDRIRDIWQDPQGNIYCQVDDNLYLFDTKTYQFSDVTDKKEIETATRLRKEDKNRGLFNGQHITYTDRQGLHWELYPDALHCQRTVSHPAQPLPQEYPAQIRCLARDRQGRIWVTTKEDATVRLYDERLNLLGYLTESGRITQTYASWRAPVYCVTQTQDGNIWMGSKPGGLFRLRPTDQKAFSIEHIGGLHCTNVYDLKEDRQGRLWIATLGGGIACVEDPGAPQPAVTHLEDDSQLRVRYLHITRNNVLMATTTEGLFVTRLEKEIGKMKLRQHLKEASRPTSLSCNATMDVLEDDQGRIFISTESGGVCEIVSKELTADTLCFRRLPLKGGWPTDVALSLTEAEGQLLITSSNQLIEYDKEQNSGNIFDSWFFNHPYRFSEVHPLYLADGRWLLGSQEGAFTLGKQEMKRTPFVPNIVLTAISIQNGLQDLAVNDLDTLLLSPKERNLTIRFAALDYTDATRISYAFRMGNANDSWNLIGHDHTVTLLDLKPGTYELWLRSTNADGVWVDNLRKLTIIAKPTFWETPWAILLLVLISLGILSAITYTLLYIKRIKRQQRETLEAYLALLSDQRDDSPEQPRNERMQENRPTEKVTSPEDDAFMKRVIAFVEENIGNSDADINQMAEAAAVSRSGLQRKMKQLLGVTPLDFIREARIKQACQLLRSSDDTIADVAYKCGFSDPKYFSRSFKQSVGVSPSEYKQAL